MKAKVNFSVHNPESSKPVPIDNAVIKKGNFWSWGTWNDFPDQMQRLHDQSDIHGSLIGTRQRFLQGLGVQKTDNEELNAFLKKANKEGDELNEILERCIYDYLLHNGFALQIVYTKLGGKIAGLYYVDIAKLRYDKDRQKLLFSEDWRKQRMHISEENQYDLYNPDNPKGTQIYFFNASPKGLYPTPQFSGCIDNIEASILMNRYHRNEIAGGFKPDVLFEMYGDEPEDEEKEIIEKGAIKKFTGVDGHNLMFSYAASKDMAMRMEAVPRTDNTGSRYIELRKAVRDSILNAHRVPVQLTAIQTDTIISIGGSDYANAYRSYMIREIEPDQAKIIKPFNKILSNFFGEVDLKINPLPVLNAFLGKEDIITQFMTTGEIRNLLKKSGFIENVDYEEGDLFKLAKSGFKPGAEIILPETKQN